MSVPRTRTRTRTRTTKPRTVRVNPAVPAPKIVTSALPPEPQEPQPLLRVFVAGNPLSANHMYGARGYGAARRLTPEARAWRDSVAVSVMPWRFPKGSRPYLSVDFAFVGLRGDVDNAIKLPADGVKLGLDVDDRYFIKISAEKRKSRVSGKRGVWVEVRQADGVEYE